MSVEEVIEDVLDGNFKHAEQRIEDWIGTLSPATRNLINTLETDAGKMAEDLSKTAAKDIVKGGIMNTDSYVTASKDIAAQIAVAGLTILLPNVFAIVNLEVSYLLGLSPQSDASQEPVTAS